MRKMKCIHWQARNPQRSVSSQDPGGPRKCHFSTLGDIGNKEGVSGLKFQRSLGGGVGRKYHPPTPRSLRWGV